MNLSAGIVWLGRVLALSGGVVLVALVLMTAVSITGRSLIWAGLSPVPGDFELVEAGAAYAVFAFLPWCQLNRGHATVDLFTSFLSHRTNRWIDVFSELLMTAVIVLIAWRLWHGMMDKVRYGETTFILQFPVWWGYAAAMVGAAVGVVVSFYVLYARIAEASTGRPVLGPGTGAIH